MSIINLVNFKDEEYKIQLETLNWRNSEHVAKYFQIKHIDEFTHKKWLENINRENSSTVAFLIEFEGEYVGITYFSNINYEQKQSDWGIYIYKEDLRGKGIGKKVIQKSLEYAKSELNLNKIFLEVLEDNLVAKSLYENVGFKFGSSKNNVLRYSLNLKEIEILNENNDIF